jgi:NADH-quinone oxidoreductase subunit L
MLEDTLRNVLPFLVLILPLAGFVVLALFGDWMRRDKEDAGAGYIACATVLAAFGLSVWSVVLLNRLPAGPEGLRYAQPYLGVEWIEVAEFRVPLNLLLDPLSAVMMLVVTGVGSLIHIYSLGYMAHDEERPRYFSYLNLFTFFMLLLVMGGNLPLLFVGWEGVGLCSYLLIGFWYKKDSASAAGMKAFVVNRIGDAGLILGMIFIFHQFGSLDLVEVATNAGALAHEAWGEMGPVTIACLLLFVGACGKSAQIPLHVWLPDAMEGPTPVSALIHAATMVTAGVYMVARLAPLYHGSETAMGVVAIVGTVTALVAGTVALVQTDIKKVLAYSTVSQLGYMFLACGVGAFGVAVFHLFTHAFFKALLFLGSGSVIHAMGGEQDMRKMGGLAGKIPVTAATFLVGTLAIAGIYPLAGFFSKDEILLAAWNAGRPVLFGIALLTALLTALYMARLFFLTFVGPFRGDPHAESHLHESPWSMLGPLLILAVGSATVGFVAIPRVVEPVLRLGAEHAHHVGWLPFVATAAALLGIGLAYYLYVARSELPARIGAALRPLRTVLEHKYYFDEVFDAFTRRVVVAGSESVLWRTLDAGLIDGAVNGLASFWRGFAERARYAETGFVRSYALVTLGGAVVVLGYLLWGR